MARSEARLKFSVWDGLDGHGPHAKLLYPVLLTEPTVNFAGVGAMRVTRWARKASLTTAETQKALAALVDSFHIVIDEDTEEVLVRTMIRNDEVWKQPFLLKGALQEALMTVSPRLRRVLAEELRKLPPKQPDGVSKAGKKIVYPDPHAAADALAAPGSEPPPETHSKGSQEGLDTHPSGSRQAPSGKGLDTHSTDNGVGEGVGEGEKGSVGLHSTSALDERFNEFYDAYPRKKDRRKAEQAYRAALKRKATPDQLIAAAKAYARSGGDPQFLKYPASWLNAEAYLDEPEHNLLTLVRPSSFEAIRDTADCEHAATLIGQVWRPPAQPPTDRTPPRVWIRQQRLAWIDRNEIAIRAALERRETA